jgi:hypothetical protein
MVYLRTERNAHKTASRINPVYYRVASGGRAVLREDANKMRNAILLLDVTLRLSGRPDSTGDVQFVKKLHCTRRRGL